MLPMRAVLTLLFMFVFALAVAAAPVDVGKPYLEPIQADSDVALHDGRLYFAYRAGAAGAPTRLPLARRDEILLVRPRPTLRHAVLTRWQAFPPYVPPPGFVRVPEPPAPGTLAAYVQAARVRFHAICPLHPAVVRASQALSRWKRAALVRPFHLCLCGRPLMHLQELVGRSPTMAKINVVSFKAKEHAMVRVRASHVIDPPLTAPSLQKYVHKAAPYVPGLSRAPIEVA
jgi:hypothetical protein